MCDILPLVSRLSCIFQSSTVDLSTLENLISSTLQSLELLADQSGVYAKKLDSDLLSTLAPFDLRHSPDLNKDFRSVSFRNL